MPARTWYGHPFTGPSVSCTLIGPQGSNHTLDVLFWDLGNVGQVTVKHVLVFCKKQNYCSY